MSAAEIIAELPRLTPGELAEIQARLSELVHSGPRGATAPVRTARIYSPRLARPQQSKDFVKRVVDPGTNAGL